MHYEKTNNLLAGMWIFDFMSRLSVSDALLT